MAEMPALIGRGSTRWSETIERSAQRVWFVGLGLKCWFRRYSSRLNAIAPVEGFSSKMSNGDD
jgi:hypothetical protein